MRVHSATLARVVVASVLTVLGAGAVAEPRVDAGSRYAAEVAQRRSFVLETYGRVANVRTHPKWFPYFVLARTRLAGCDPRLSEYMAGVLEQVDPAPDGVSDPEMFAEPPLARFVHLHRDCLTPEQTARIARALERPRHLFEHGTINMAAIRSTSRYLMAQAFPDAVWTDHDGERYGRAALQKKLGDLTVRRYRRFLQDGETEQLSPTYTAANFFAALNLVEFASNPAVRAYAEAYAVQMLTVLRLSSVQGVILAPLHRQNTQQRSGPARVGRPCVSPGQQLLWLYFGEPEIGARDLDSGCEPTYVTMLADSAWLPPALLASVPDPDALPVEHTIAVPEFSQWDAPARPLLFGRVFRSRSFAVGSGNTIVSPDGYHMADNTFTLAWRRSGAEYNYVECVHPYWTSNVGPDAWSTIKVPPNFYPNATSRSSPFQQSFFDRGRGVLLFSIPEKDPWPSSRDPRFFAARDEQKDKLFARQNCHFPKDVDEWRQDGSWVFIRANGTYLAIEAVGLKPALNDVADYPTVLGFVKLTTEGRHVALFFVADEASRHASFAAFQDSVRTIPRRHDPDRDVFTFQGEGGAQNVVAFRLDPEPGTGRVRSIPAVTRDGKPVSVAAEPIINGPGYSVGRGRIHVETGAGTLDVASTPGEPPALSTRLRP